MTTGRVYWGEAPVTGEEGFALPVGTVTFLLTDVEGSTQLWEARADAMGAAVARHYEILSEAIAGNGGVRPVEQGEGDSVVGAYARPSDAVSAALQAQRALLAADLAVPLRVRMAVHTGQAQLRDEGNYFGQAVNRCARLRAIANGGQVLLSRATHDLVVDFLPEGVVLEDLGPHRLRDLARPEHVYQLCHPDLPAQFQPLRSLDALPNNLPLQLSSFVGRDRELRDMRTAFKDARLVTLTGSGGCGKTRLALQVAADLVDEYPDGVWWVDLAPLTDPGLVTSAAASTLGVKEIPGQALVDTLLHHLRERRSLVVLDNCEHLIGACASFVDALVRACPGMSVLATSREPLGVEAETSWRVPSLELPSESEIPRIETLAQCEAVRLFVERAMKVRPNFAVTNDNAPAVAEICHRLEGIPLAIELAAARVRMLTPEQIAEGLQNRFQLLTGGARTALPRQRTLEASVEWSYNLLTEDERAVLRRLCVFAGGFTLEAAERVCPGDGIEPYGVLDLIAHLVDRSLVQVEEDGPAASYRMLETIRHYGLQKLSLSEAEAATARDAHLAYFVEFAERAEPDLEGEGLMVALARMDAQLDNVRAAFDWAALHARADDMLRIAGALPLYWVVRSHNAEATMRYDRALAAGGDGALRGKALVAAALANVYGGADPERIEAFAGEALRLAREVGDGRTAARALSWFAGLSGVMEGPSVARPKYEEAVELTEREQDLWYLSQNLVNLGLLETQSGRPDAATRALGRAIETAKRNGDLLNLREGFYWLATARAAHGQLESARATGAEALAISERLDDRLFIRMSHVLFGTIHTEQGHYDEARASFTEALSDGRDLSGALFDPILYFSLANLDYAEGRLDDALAHAATTVDLSRAGLWWYLALSCALLGRVAVLTGDLARAEEALREAEDLGRRIEIRRGLGFSLLGRAELALARDEDAAPFAYEAVAVFAEANDPGGVAEALELAGSLNVRIGAHEHAVRLLAAASALRARAGICRYLVHEALGSQALEAARSGVGDAFGEVWASGEKLSLPEAAAYAMRARGTRGRPTAGWSSLTPTEIEVVRLVSEGLTNPQIGERLFISRGTVKVHLSHIFAKLGVSTRSELAAAATRRNV
jgi:predicted ATPase/class 3 adenylate cyclase/DNA-binding CsgD family transcriptional regulator